LAAQVVYLTNLEREAQGLPPLKANALLSQAARAHSLAMAERDFFDHKDPQTGSTSADRAHAAGYAWAALGENIAMGYATPEDVVRGWMASPGHRRNILSLDFREIGVGYIAGPGPSASCQHAPCQDYWTQVFGTSSEAYPVVIDSEAPYASSPNVTLYCYGLGWAQQMHLRHDQQPYGPWEPFQSSRSWQLPDSPGLHTVSVELRDSAGQIREASDEICLGQPTSFGTPAAIPPSTTPQPGAPVPTPGSDRLTLQRGISSPIVTAGQEVLVTFTLAGNQELCGRRSVRLPLDIVLVIDHSGSMGAWASFGSTQTKLEAAKDAAIAFLGAVQLGTDRVAIVGFSGDARLQRPLEVSLQPLQQAINSLQPTGGTSIADGLLAAQTELGKRGRKEAAGVVILLSDGQSPARQVAEQMKKAGLRIATIGLGPDVDADELSAIASSPQDYYPSPDATQLKAIFLAVAQSIRETPAATDVELVHRFDVSNFEIVPNSISPAAELSYDRITWRAPLLGKEPLTFSYRARARVAGSFAADLGDVLTYRRCGEDQASEQLSSGLNVQVQGDPALTPPAGAEPVTPVQLFLDVACGGFPWWYLLALIVYLILLFLILARNWKKLRQRWTSRKQWPPLCLIGRLLFLGYVLFLAALVVGELQPVACRPKEAIYFWRVTPQGDSAIWYKPMVPALPARVFGSLTRQSKCIACHTISLEGDRIAAIADGSNGPVYAMLLDGTPFNLPPITASYVALSPDGRSLAYAFEGKDIYILDLSSGATVPLNGASEPDITETMPAWSPDSQTIAFVRTHGEPNGYALTTPCDILTIPAAGGTPTLLPGAGGSGFSYYPAYSPDGNWLAFTGHTTGTSTRSDPQAEIFLVPSQGGEARRLAANDLPGGQPLVGASNSWPTWSPDGRYLAFNSKRNGGQFDVFVATINPDGTSGPAESLAGVSRSAAFEHLPVWGKPPLPNWLAILLRLLPWLVLLPLLWLLTCLLCRPRTLQHTIALRRKVTPDSGEEEKDLFTVTLTLDGNPSGCATAYSRQPLDVALVIDHSGSMVTPSLPGLHRLDGAKRAVQGFVARLDPAQDRAAVVIFSDTATLLQPLSADWRTLRREVGRISGGSGTAIDEGLAAALAHLSAARRPGVAAVIVLLSDGESAEEPALAQAAAIRQAGIRLVTIGLGRGAGMGLLRQLATTPQDCYYSAGAGQLQQVFRSIAERIRPPLAGAAIAFRHRPDLEAFSLVPSTTNPQSAPDEQGIITWELPELGAESRTFSYQVLGKKPGARQLVDLGDTVTYLRCGDEDEPMELREGPGLPVTVTEHKKVIEVQPPPAPLPITDLPPIWEPDKALLIGVGRMGRVVLTHLKKNLRDAGCGVVPPGLPFLLLDTAPQVEGHHLAFAGTALSDEEVVLLREDLKPVIAEMASGTGSHVELGQWFPAQDYANLGSVSIPELARGAGERPIARAGMLRLINGKAGRSAKPKAPDSDGPPAASVLNSPLLQRLGQALDKVKVDPHGARVILIGSLSEAMGATLWDLAYLVREVARSKWGSTVPVTIEAYLGFEIQPGKNYVPAAAELNAMAALRELTWFQLNPGLPYAIDYGTGEPGLEPLRVRLIDDLYLYFTDLVPGGERQWPALADLVTLRLDSRAYHLQDADWYQFRRADVDARQAQTHELHFGSGGSVTIRLPLAEIIDRVKLRWARELVQSFLMGLRREEPSFDAEGAADPQFGRPEHLADLFLCGLEDESARYALAVPVPLSVRALNCVRLQQAWQDQPVSDEAAEQQAVGAYLDATLQLILMGTSAASAQPPHTARVAYAAAFLKALNGLCEGALGQAIAEDSSLSQAQRQTLEGYRLLLQREVQAREQGLTAMQQFLLGLYSELAAREALFVAQQAEPDSSQPAAQAGTSAPHRLTRREEMDQVQGRFYLWQQRTAPDGKPLENPRQLWDIWYDAVYEQTRPEDHTGYLFWRPVPEGGIELCLLLGEEPVSSHNSQCGTFCDRLLDLAQGLIQPVISERKLDSLADLGESILFELQDHLPAAQRGRSRPALLASLVAMLQQQARPASLDTNRFNAGQAVLRNAIAAPAPLPQSLAGLIAAFPPTDRQQDGATQRWDWPRLLLTDRTAWQLVLTQDALTANRLVRYEGLTEQLIADARGRAVFDWEALAWRHRQDYKGELLHPLVAAALQRRVRAHLYGVALASGLVRGRADRWGIWAEQNPEPLVSWQPKGGWDPYVYGLLHFALAAAEEQVSAVDELLGQLGPALRAEWKKLIDGGPEASRPSGASEQVRSLWVLSWYAVRERYGRLPK